MVDDVVREFPVTSGMVLQRQVASIKAVSGVSFVVGRGQTFGLVGESGCGKTTLGKIIVGLEKPDRGRITLRGTDVAALGPRQLRHFRKDLQMMFQDPIASLDPRMRVGALLREPMKLQGVGTRRQQDKVISDLLGEVGLPANAVERFPHEFSGGQRQRIGLARALTLNPQVIVADEPVSALDVSIRSQVLNLMKRTQRDHGLTYVVISHDLAVVKYMADTIGVMYLGKLVEVGSGDDIYRRPVHHYTAALIAAVPEPDPTRDKAQLIAANVRGELPSPLNPPSGCRFRTRCPAAQLVCAQEEPPLRSFGPGHMAACHFPLLPPVENDGAASAGATAAGVGFRPALILCSGRGFSSDCGRCRQPGAPGWRNIPVAEGQARYRCAVPLSLGGAMADSGSPIEPAGQSAEPDLNLGGTPPSYPPPSFPPPSAPPPPPPGSGPVSPGAGAAAGLHPKRENTLYRPRGPLQDALGARSSRHPRGTGHLLAVVDHFGVPARCGLRLPRARDPSPRSRQRRLGGGGAFGRGATGAGEHERRQALRRGGFRQPAPAASPPP